MIFLLFGCSRAPVKLVDELSSVGESAANAILEQEKQPDISDLEFSYSESRIPLTVNLIEPLPEDVSNVDVYLLHMKIKAMIDKKSFVGEQLTFKPNRQYYQGTYYGDTLSFKYIYQGKEITQNISLKEERNTLSIAFRNGKFEILKAEFLIPYT